MILVVCDQGSPEWFAARAGVITASRFSDARAKYAKDYGQAKKGDPKGESHSYARLIAAERISARSLDDTFKTWQMERGTALEPDARALYEAKTGSIAFEGGISLTDDRVFGYSTDGKIMGANAGIEIKVPSACHKVAGIWFEPEPIISEYMDQIQGGMWITGWDWIDLVIYTPWLSSVGRELFVRRILRDEAYIASLEADLLSFSGRVDLIESALRAPIEAIQA